MKTPSECEFIQLRLQKGPWMPSDDNRVSAFLGRPLRWTQKLKSKESKNIPAYTNKIKKKKSSSFSKENYKKGCGIFCGTLLGAYDVECRNCRKFICHRPCLKKLYTDRKIKVPLFDDNWKCPECVKN